MYCHGITLLHSAASAGQLDILTRLLVHGEVLVNAQDRIGRTPLDTARMYKRGDIIEQLLLDGGRSATDLRE